MSRETSLLEIGEPYTIAYVIRSGIAQFVMPALGRKQTLDALVIEYPLFRESHSKADIGFNERHADSSSITSEIPPSYISACPQGESGLRTTSTGALGYPPSRGTRNDSE